MSTIANIHVHVRVGPNQKNTLTQIRKTCAGRRHVKFNKSEFTRLFFVSMPDYTPCPEKKVPLYFLP